MKQSAWLIGISSLVLAGCGGGSDDISSSGDPLTADQAATSAAMMIVVADSASSAANSSSAGTAAFAAPIAKAQQAATCDSGSLSSQALASQNVSSPYTQLKMPLIAVTATACRYPVNRANDDGSSVAGHVDLNGAIRYGKVTDNGAEIGYLRAGESSSAPLGLDANLTVTSSTSNGAPVQVNTVLDSSLDLRLDTKSSSAGDGQTYVMDYAGTYTVTNQAAGGKSVTAKFDATLGLSNEPFVVFKTNTTASFDGAFGLSLTPAPKAGECLNETLHISTKEVLVYSDATQKGFKDGTLQLSKGSEAPATVSFNADGSVTVAANGQTKNYPYSAFTALAQSCVDPSAIGL